MPEFRRGAAAPAPPTPPALAQEPPSTLSTNDLHYLADLQARTFDYFCRYAHPDTGLVADKTSEGAPASIAATGLGLACLAVGVERGLITRAEAIARARRTLRFFHESEQSERPRATGYRGFYYHFLDMESGRRFRHCELSTIDTALLLVGALAAYVYFDGHDEAERDVRALASALYRRAEWDWAFDGGPAVRHAWKPETGFLKARWYGYNEAILLYLLALGAPSHPIPPRSYEAWTSTYRWRRVYGVEHLYAGPLFIHQLPHCWVDFRGLYDAYMRERGIDYFENSRRAVLVQRAYATRNPRGLKGYGPDAWGITASDGPGRYVRVVDGQRRRFYGYHARGAPWGPDDGTLSPWAVAAAVPFAPELVLRALRHFDATYPEITNAFGYVCSFNPTFPTEDPHGWRSHGHFGIDQGPVVLMIENYRSELVWKLMKRCPFLVAGLRRAGFSGGWLDANGQA
ncbi:MAG TPA: glucoamylase family protein [Rubricoccaceae bacterium]|nr:glucoamylase family protein [Rubricoccaceae bacterium]